MERGKLYTVEGDDIIGVECKMIKDFLDEIGADYEQILVPKSAAEYSRGLFPQFLTEDGSYFGYGNIGLHFSMIRIRDN